MIELRHDSLVFTFPEVHPDARLEVSFQRTLRIPDDGKEYPLPPGLGKFPVRLVDDHPRTVPPRWIERGGVMFPLYQSEALWILFWGFYPMAVKVAAGKIDAVTGEDWSDRIHSRPQNYVVTPQQPWLDGYCVEKGVIRQFVAMPLGSGYSAEEQLTGRAQHGGIQLLAHPMKREAYEKDLRSRTVHLTSKNMVMSTGPSEDAAMGLAPGGRMTQEIFEDPHPFEVWDTSVRSRCFVNTTNSLVWRAITGEEPPTVPPTAREYEDAGLPWFEYYAEGSRSLGGADRLRELEGVAERAKRKGEAALPENEGVDPKRVVALRRGLRRNQVREGSL
jgi:hypothetical protein